MSVVQQTPAHPPHQGKCKWTATTLDSAIEHCRSRPPAAQCAGGAELLGWCRGDDAVGRLSPERRPERCLERDARLRLSRSASRQPGPPTTGTARARPQGGVAATQRRSPAAHRTRGEARSAQLPPAACGARAGQGRACVGRGGQAVSSGRDHALPVAPLCHHHNPDPISSARERDVRRGMCRVPQVP